MLRSIETGDLLALSTFSPVVHDHLHAFSQLTSAAQGVATILLAYQLTDTLVEQEVHVHLGSGDLSGRSVAGLSTILLEGTVAQHVDILSGTGSIVLLDTGLGTQQIGIGQTHDGPVLNDGVAEVVGRIVATPLSGVGIHGVQRVGCGPVAAVASLYSHLGGTGSTFINTVWEAVDLLDPDLLVHTCLVGIQDATDIMVRVTDITLLVDTILHIVAQAQTAITTATDRVGIHHEVGQLVESGHPVTTLLRAVDGTTSHVAAILHLEHPDTLGVTFRTALVVPAEHIAVIVTGLTQILTVAFLNKLVVTAVDGS